MSIAKTNAPSAKRYVRVVAEERDFDLPTTPPRQTVSFGTAPIRMKNILVTGASSAPAQPSSFRRRTTTWVAIARALANDPQVILADEPTGNLDTNNSQRAFELLANIVREREKALLLVTHNRFTADACDWVHEMKDGLLIASHPHGQQISV